MCCQNVRSYINPVTIGNWKTSWYAREGHGSISWRFFCVFNHHLHRFPRYARIETMKRCAIIPDISITASKILKREGKVPHRNLIFLEHPLLTSLLFPRNILLNGPLYPCHTHFKNIISLSQSFRILIALHPHPISCPYY